jgi:ElaB/YqjD/DUF883 family membrane-anchored ribosome-binding protein
MPTANYTGQDSKPNGLQDAYNQVKDKAEQVKDQAADAASRAADQGAAALKQAEQKAMDAYSSTKRFVEEQPLLAIGIAAGAALAVGALWKLSQSQRRDDVYSRIVDAVDPHYRALRRKL